MPRIKPTTTFTPRVKPTTDYTRPRNWDLMSLTCDSTHFTCDTTLVTCDATMAWEPLIETVYNRPRYGWETLQLETSIDILLENDEIIFAEWGAVSNIITTIYT